MNFKKLIMMAVVAFICKSVEAQQENKLHTLCNLPVLQNPYSLIKQANENRMAIMPEQYASFKAELKYCKEKNEFSILQTNYKKEHFSLQIKHNLPRLIQLSVKDQKQAIDLQLNEEKKDFYFNNRRNKYSALWAFTSLNYLYADIAGLMDKNLLLQYQNGLVDGTRITPAFLTAAAGLMQIPLVNVFLPQVIKNDRTLRWVQIVSGTIMSIIQSGTLFYGKPTSYYLLFSAVEIATTTYITIDAIKWKAKKRSKIQ